MVEAKKDISQLAPLFRQNLETGEIERITPLLNSADIFLKGYKATGETKLLEIAQRLMEKYVKLSGEPLL